MTAPIDAPGQDPGREPADRSAPLRAWACRIGLAILPLVLGLVGYYRPTLAGHPLPPLVGDGAFYVYQLTRAAELGGRWWAVDTDERLGYPYPPITARHPGIFEGVDLMLASALTGRVLGPTANYHALALLMLGVNGWVAAWLAYRLTRSYGWSALAILLITLNDPTAGRLGGHLHLFKLGWALLAVAAFARYLAAPTRRRGLALGLAAAWALASSFYLGFLLGIGLAAWWLGCLLAGRLRRAHLGATLAAGLGFAAAGAALTFPVWTNARGAAQAGQYFQRQRYETWLYGAELWQYFVPPNSPVARDYISGFTQKSAGAFWEGWYYPGHVVLLAVLGYAVARLRGRRPPAGDPAFLDLTLGLIGVFVVLSLAGGPSFLIYQWYSGFRCYGRAGLLALSLGCVATPAILQWGTRAIRKRWLRGAIVAGLVALAAFDGAKAARRFHFAGPRPGPAWSDWLGKQPGGVRLAAFGPGDGDPFYWWGIDSLDRRLEHAHATLNGGEFELFQGDLALAGGSWGRLTPESLRMVLSFGYDAIAFHREYLDGLPWIAASPLLERREDLGEWSIFRANPRAARYPSVAPADLLAGLDREAPRSVPAGAWITGRLALGRNVVVTSPNRIRLAWEDGQGRRLGRPAPALLQHVFGPDMPAYTVRSPEAAGPHRLVFLDEAGRRLAAVPYVVDPGLKVWSKQDGGPPEGSGRVEVEVGATGPARVFLVNDGPRYFQAHSYRDPNLGAAAVQPGMSHPAPGSLVLRVKPLDASGGGVECLLPADLPPGGRIEVPVAMATGQGKQETRVEVTPHILWPGPLAAPAGVRLEVIGAGRPGAGVVRR